MITLAIVVALCLYSLHAGWSVWWKFYHWRTRWRVVIKPDGYDGVKVFVGKKFSEYNRDRVEIGNLKPNQEDFYEALLELTTVAEERASELNRARERYKVK